MKLSRASHSQEGDDLGHLVAPRSARRPRAPTSTMASTRSRSGGKSRTTRRTSASTERTASSRSARSSGARRRSSSKCMTDSVAGAPLGCRMRAMPPSAERSVPTIGCSTRTMPRPRACELGADGVHEEGQVLGVGLEDRAAGLVAVLGAGRVEGPHRHRGPVARGRELEGAQDLVVQRLGVVAVLVGRRRQAAQVGLRERAAPSRRGQAAAAPARAARWDPCAPIMPPRARRCHSARDRSARTARPRAG